MSELVADLIRYIDRSPTPYHAVAETAARLRAANYRQVEEDEIWAFAPGDRRFIVRNEGSLVAFEVGEVVVSLTLPALGTVIEALAGSSITDGDSLSTSIAGQDIARVVPEPSTALLSSLGLLLLSLRRRVQDGSTT